MSTHDYSKSNGKRKFVVLLSNQHLGLTLHMGSVNSQRQTVVINLYLFPECTANSHLVDTLLLWTLATMDKIQIPIYRGLTQNDSRYYELSLFRTQNDVRNVSTITMYVGSPGFDSHQGLAYFLFHKFMT